jgi:tetratricopeptide (TPR) repeat protein
MKRLHQARELHEQDEVDKAYDIVKVLLLEHPDNYLCLQMEGHIYDKAGNIPVAYQMFRAATQANPRDANGWICFGRIAEWIWRTEEAEKAYEKGLKFADRDETVAYAAGNLASLCIDNARYEEAEAWARKCIEIDPADKLAMANIGFSQLARGNWAEGWKNYHNVLGYPVRTKFQYGDEPEWDGSPDKVVALYGEQGIGDELSFSSMVPDAVAVSKQVILDCDARLHGLFKRSFPQAKVYGTRKYKPVKDRPLLWGVKPEASLAIGQVGEFFRQSPSDCPGTPYLVPCPKRLLMWRALWETKQKPRIGIAWKGGTHKTGHHMRRWTLESLLPVLKAVDAHWVVLEYRSAAAELEEFKRAHPEIDIEEYPFATLTADYDDTAALVASLDMVFTIQTSVAHLGGALGVPTWVCVPPCSQWRYGAEGESIPWYKSMRVIRRGAEWDFDKIGKELAAHFQLVSGTAKAVA